MSGSSVGQVVGGVIGGVIGFISGGPVGALRGASIGYSLGGIVDPPAGPTIEGPRLEDRTVTTATYGAPRNLVYGDEIRVGGNVIWASEIRETVKKKKSGSKGGGGSTTKTYSYAVDLAIEINARRSVRVKRAIFNKKVVFDIFAPSPMASPASDDVNGQLFTKAEGTHSVFDELHFWPGSATQVPDPLIEAAEGAGNVPAYRHRTYVTIKNLQLADFGNQIPYALEFELEADTLITAGEVIKDITDRAGIPVVSVFGLHEHIVRGYAITRDVTAAGAVNPLALGYNLDVAEAFGQLRFLRRARTIRGTVPLDFMGCHTANSDPIPPITFESAQSTGLPKKYEVTFSDPAFDYQENTAVAVRDAGATNDIGTVQLPLTMTVDEGRRAADRFLWTPWIARKTASFNVDDGYLPLCSGDIYGLPVADQILPYKIIEKIRGDNGVIELTAQREDPETYASNAFGVSASAVNNVVTFPGETRLLLLDTPIYRDLDDDTGFYWAVDAESTGWRGADVKRSSDGGTSYSTISEVGLRTVIGDVASALPDGPTFTWDDGNTLTVVLNYSGAELESLTDLDILNGSNAAYLGSADGQNGEIIQFVDATLIAPKTYTLSRLLRGRLGTEANTSIHGSNEVFVLLDLSTMGRSEFGAGDWDAERKYKGVSFFTDEQDATAIDFTNTGVGKKPYSPVHVVGTRDGSNNLTITWVRRSRYRSGGIAGPVPLGELTEAYEVDVLDAPGGNVLRTITATSETASYSAAEQTTDGLTPGDPVDVVIYQMSDSIGRGFPRTAEI